MRLKREPLKVDFFVNPRPLTEDENIIIKSFQIKNHCYLTQYQKMPGLGIHPSIPQTPSQWRGLYLMRIMELIRRSWESDLLKQ